MRERRDAGKGRGMAGMNIQQRAAETLSKSSPSAARDVAEASVREATAYDHVGAGIAEVDRDGRIFRVNRKLCELTGREAAGLLGSSIFARTSQEDIAYDSSQFARQVAGEIDRYVVEKRLF